MAIRTWVPIATAGALLALMGRAEPVDAHLHVWIDAVVTFVFEDGQLVGLRHRWKFDEFFGSFVIEEHDVDRDGALDEAEIAAIQANAFANLRDYDYLTHVRIDGEEVPLSAVKDFAARIEDGVLLYEFAMLLPEPIEPGSERFAAGVFDPEYYIEVLLDEDDPVRFEGLPNGVCTYAVREDQDHPIYYGMVYPPTVVLSCATS
jgi:ABC-type uncharacterized transport system substrate-binding protein